LEGMVVRDPEGAGVCGVVEVDDPIVARAGARGVVQDQAVMLTAGLGHEEVEVGGGRRGFSFTTSFTSRQVVINRSVHP